MLIGRLWMSKEFAKMLIGFVRILIGFVGIIIGFVRMLTEHVKISVGFIKMFVGFVRIFTGSVRVPIKNIKSFSIKRTVEEIISIQEYQAKGRNVQIQAEFIWFPVKNSMKSKYKGKTNIP